MNSSIYTDKVFQSNMFILYNKMTLSDNKVFFSTHLTHAHLFITAQSLHKLRFAFLNCNKKLNYPCKGKNNHVFAV